MAGLHCVEPPFQAALEGWRRWLPAPLRRWTAGRHAGAQAEAMTLAVQVAPIAVAPIPVDPARLSADLILIRAARLHAMPGSIRRRRRSGRPPATAR